MKTRLFLTFLGFMCLLSLVKSKCDLGDRKQPVEFPNIEKYVAESYVMGVEMSIRGSQRTDYFTEYYDNVFKRGRVDSHINGANQKFIYRSETWEAWTLEKRRCVLNNITTSAEFFSEHPQDWLHYSNSGSKCPTTIGPSAMLKVAYDEWKKPEKDRKMAYFGEAGDIRGEKAVYWRRCLNDTYYVDYYFADEGVENPFDTEAFDKVVTPLRITFRTVTETQGATGAIDQSYDIISFQHLIPEGVEPFQLPKGRNCQRGTLVDGPKLPDFSSSSMLLHTEVVYQKYSTEDDAYELMSSYYSSLMLAFDRQLNHLAYFYSSWNTSKPDKDHEEPFVNAPNYIIYDLTHGYAYNTSIESGKCQVSRPPGFVPQYNLPEGRGSLDLTDPFVLFPNDEMTYLTTGKDRGLDVNIFEAEVDGFLLSDDTPIDRLISTHSYLKSNEVEENNVEVKNAPTQVQLTMRRMGDIEDVLTLNIFGFTTRIPPNFRQYIFDITRCFKNDDDYKFLTIGFEVQPADLDQLIKRIPDIEQNVVTAITLKSELNIVRIPNIMTDVKGNYIYVTLLILDKPPLELDFISENGTSVVASSVDDTQGASNFKTCANNCLEDREECWGFSVCGGTCYFGSSTSTKVETKTGCTLYRRFNNNTFIQSKEIQINNIVGQIEAGEFITTATLDNGERRELVATVAQVTDPAADDSLFEKMGNMLNPRMKVQKAASKLKKDHPVKNMGKLRYDECQSLCLDFKDCETISYCLIDASCTLSNKFGSDLKADDMEADELCTILTRKYTDHFDRTPGVFVKVGEGTNKEATTVEDCARACLKEESFKCLSFDHCAGVEKKGCTLYTTHYLNPQSRHDVQGKHPSCGHYTRKFSNEFKRKDETIVLGSKIPPILNMTLEECAKTCIEYGQGTCYGYNFCQDKDMYATSCTLFDTDPSRLESTPSDVCANYIRTGAEYAARPFTNGYAGGIGFLCFVIGGVVGAVVVFIIAYIRVNRR